MKFLPYEHIIYKTRLKEEEIIRRLSDCIEPEKTFRIRFIGIRSKKPYEGEINGLSFRMNRIINYRNSFLPRITGVIEKEFDGLRINVKMRLHIFVLVFLCVWCVGVGLGSLVFLTLAINHLVHVPMALIPLGMLVFSYLLTMGAFKFESIKSKKYLQEILEAEIITKHDFI